MEALQGLQELLSGRLLANSHASRRVLGRDLNVVDRTEPAGKQRLNCLGLLFEDGGAHRQQIDDLTRNAADAYSRILLLAKQVGSIRP